METGRLLLAPTDPAACPEPEAVTAALVGLGLVADGAVLNAGGALAGEQFLRLVTFLGCSPSLRLAPDDPGARPLTRIRCLGPYPEPRLLTGANTRAPRCRDCRTPFPAWHAARAGSCAGCGARLDPARLDWRRQAGLGRLFVEISEVFPGEAVPSAGLLAGLERATGRAWDHFYLQGDRA